MERQTDSGTWVTMITPFTEDNAIDYAGVEALVEWYVEKGLAGIFAVCQSSEMFFLSLAERTALAKFVIEKAAGRIPVVVSGHVSESLDDQVEELAAMAGTGPQAVVLVSNRLARRHEADEVWKKNVLRVLEAIPDVQFGIYECPYPYKRLMTPALLKWCAGTGRFSFIKDTCCDVKQLREKIEAVRGSSLKLFNANSATALESLKMGAAGFCGVMLNFHPELYNWLCVHWEEDVWLAERLQAFATLASLIEMQMYPVNAKYHMSLRGPDIPLYTRSKDHTAFGALQKLEVQALADSWAQLSVEIDG